MRMDTPRMRPTVTTIMRMIIRTGMDTGRSFPTNRQL
jgi:hypothetical protein